LNAAESPWAFRTLSQDSWYRWRLDGAEVFLKNVGSSWYWATRPKHPEGLRQDFGGPEVVEAPYDLEIHHVLASCQPVALRPFALSRPFVVRATRAISVLAGEQAEFLVDLPVSVHWMTSAGVVLAHPNTIELHKTWFGDTSAGRLCFLWPTTLEAPPNQPYGSMFRCHIQVRNEGKSPLVLRQFPIYCEYLSLWEEGGSLRSDLVVVESLGDQSLRMTTEPYKGSDQGLLLYEAAVTQSEVLFQRGVDFLRNIAGIS